jgi:hypothetical protein
MGSKAMIIEFGIVAFMLWVSIIGAGRLHAETRQQDQQFN